MPVKKVGAVGEMQVEHAAKREPSRVGSRRNAPVGVQGAVLFYFLIYFECLRRALLGLYYHPFSMHIYDNKDTDYRLVMQEEVQKWQNW